MSNYVTTGTAARDLGISTSVLTRWVTSGRLTPAQTTPGGHYRWDLPILRAQVRRIQAGPTDPGQIIAEDIARVVHAAQRELQIVQGDPRPSPPWDDAPDYQCRQCVAGVALSIAGASAQEAHEAWCERMRADGWVYGPVKDEAARTHPCLVPYSDQPQDQRLKDVLLIAIVRALGVPAHDQ